MKKWGSKIEIEKRNRIILSVYAYAYEIEISPLVSDQEYDELSYKIDSTLETGNGKLDDFFLMDFDPASGLWIYDHPELDKVKKLYISQFTKN